EGSAAGAGTGAAEGGGEEEEEGRTGVALVDPPAAPFGAGEGAVGRGLWLAGGGESGSTPRSESDGRRAATRSSDGGPPAALASRSKLSSLVSAPDASEGADSVRTGFALRARAPSREASMGAVLERRWSTRTAPPNRRAARVKTSTT